MVTLLTVAQLTEFTFKKFTAPSFANSDSILDDHCIVPEALQFKPIFSHIPFFCFCKLSVTSQTHLKSTPLPLKQEDTINSTA